jgi:hypothetical protein
MFDYGCGAVRRANVSAAKGIPWKGLGNDYTYEGAAGGRTAIMVNPFGPEDECNNKHSRRDSGEVHVSVDVPYWCLWCGQQANSVTGVRLFVTSCGVLVFSNMDPSLPTVISTKCFHREMMRCNVNNWQGDLDRTGSCVLGYSKNWYQVRQAELVDHCDPPLDQVVDGVAHHYSLLPTLGEIPTPHMGLKETTGGAGTVRSRAPWILDSERILDAQISGICFITQPNTSNTKQRPFNVSRVWPRACVNVVTF